MILSWSPPTDPTKPLMLTPRPDRCRFCPASRPPFQLSDWRLLSDACALARAPSAVCTQSSGTCSRVHSLRASR